MPKSNTYPALVEAAKSLSNTEIFSGEEPPSPKQAASFLKANARALLAAREALNGHCRVEVENDIDFLGAQAEVIGALMDLGRAFDLAAQDALYREDWPALAAAGEAQLDLADAARRGGLKINALASISIESIAVESIASWYERLPPPLAARLATRLVVDESGRESYSAIVERDRAWEQAVGYHDGDGESGEIADLIKNVEFPDAADCDIDPEEMQFMMEAMSEFAELSEEDRYQLEQDMDLRNLAALRHLAINAALLAYRGAHDEYPDRLERLVPDFLPALPINPLTEAAFEYERAGSTYRLDAIESACE